MRSRRSPINQLRRPSLHHSVSYPRSTIHPRSRSHVLHHSDVQVDSLARAAASKGHCCTPSPINTRMPDCSRVGRWSFLPLLNLHTHTIYRKRRRTQTTCLLRFEGEIHGSLIAPDLAIAVQVREISSSSSPKTPAFGSAIAVQIKELFHFIKFLSLVRPLWYKPRYMFNLLQNFVFGSAIAVQTKELMLYPLQTLAFSSDTQIKKQVSSP